MASRKKPFAEVSAEALRLDVPGVSEDTPEGISPAEEAPGAPVEAVQPATVEPAGTVAPEHADIGNWEATYWRGRPLWRHKRTKHTLFNRAEVWRQRNLK